MKLFPSILLLPGLLHADPLKLTWQPNPPEDAVIVYVVYESQPDGSVVEVAEVHGGLTDVTIETLPGIHRYFVAAQNEWGEGEPSDVVTTAAGKPGPPVQNDPHTVVLQSSSDLLTWTTAVAYTPPEMAAQFFRAVFAAELTTE